ncbi:response regulator [Desulfuromonas sp. TF]|uniref:response regulator n=1 Tax=Desulfuromonas sp. TF TaxID=1232410 RepID=UPI000421720F|nr:response regulator [Desulfuromonas sp. TF]
MSKKLLLADDSITIQKVIGITFANEEYDLTIVDNGAIALVRARAERPDLILSDVFMPGKNGYELTAAVKQDPLLQGVPVLLLAGTFEPFDEDKARTSGADGWISKPFESQALIDRVEELLAKGAAAAPAPEPVAEAPAADREEEPAAEWEETFEPGQEPASTDDDLWGAVSFAEEDLGEEPEEFEEEAFVLEEEPVELKLPTSEISGLAQEEDFLFEDEPLELAESPVEKALLRPEEEPFVFEEEPLDLAEETADDKWGNAAAEEEDFVFEEDPLELMEEPPAGEQSAEPAVSAKGDEFDWEELTEPESAASWEESEEEILILEEADILEEEELGIDSFITAETASVALKWEESEETLAAGRDEDIFAAPGPVMAAGQAAEEEFSLSEEGPEWGIAEPDLEEEEPLALEEEGVPAEPVFRPAPASASPESVAAQVQGLSDEELARVVEKVAGTVIERLASTILEKIAWEVIPDLAESMIRDELRRLKGED